MASYLLIILAISVLDSISFRLPIRRHTKGLLIENLPVKLYSSNTDNVYDDGVVDFATVEDSLRYFREYAKRGLQRFQERNLEGSLADFNRALQANSSQPLIQRGIALYCNGNYEVAVEQLSRDIKILEISRVFKASEVRIWLSAAYNKLGRREEAVAILDHNNLSPTGLVEQRLLMNTTLHFFAGSVQLDEVMDIVGNVDERDMYGFGFFGNFYLGLYYDSIGEREMAKTFLQFSQSSKRYPEKDMWYHIPRVLYTARGFDEEDDSQGDL